MRSTFHDKVCTYNNCAKTSSILATISNDALTYQMLLYRNVIQLGVLHRVEMAYASIRPTAAAWRLQLPPFRNTTRALTQKKKTCRDDVDAAAAFERRCALGQNRQF